MKQIFNGNLKSKFFIMILIAILAIPSFAKEKSVSLTNLNMGEDSSKCEPSKLSVSYGVDLVSRYIWRGVEFGVSSTNAVTPHFQPTAALSYDLGSAGALSLGVWGSYGFDGDYSENDIYFNYIVSSQVGGFSFTLNDYYYPYLGIPFTNTDGKGVGAHTIDAQFSYTLPEVFPLTVLISNNIHNDVPDYKSLYFEASYPFSISNTSVNLFAGAAKGPSLWHGVTTNKFEMVNVGFKLSKSIKFSQDFSLPVGIAWIFNAHQKKTFLVFKATL